jgi:hypothetical protein
MSTHPERTCPPSRIRLAVGPEPFMSAVMVLQDRGVSRSCGMHAFGLPDAQVEAPPKQANQILGVFNVYQLAEDPVLVSGDTFQPDLDTPTPPPGALAGRRVSAGRRLLQPIRYLASGP